MTPPRTWPFVLLGILALAWGASAGTPWSPAVVLAAPLQVDTGLPISVVQPFTEAGFGLLLLGAFLALWRALERRTEGQLAAYKEAAASQVAAYRERQEQDRRQHESLQAAWLQAASIAETQRQQWAHVQSSLTELEEHVTQASAERQAQVASFSETNNREYLALMQAVGSVSTGVESIKATLAERRAREDPSASNARRE